MDQDSGNMEENFRVTRRFWGFRPWKRHSLILTVGGFLYVMIGFSYIRSPLTPGREILLKILLQVAPIQVWGSIFVLSGLLSMLSSCWPLSSEKWGYMVLTGMSSGWGSTHLLGAVFFDSPSVAFTQALLWGILAFMWWGISGLSNPETVAVKSHE
jgi:hypothetical protein